jgi:hypothetical protein
MELVSYVLVNHGLLPEGNNIDCDCGEYLSLKYL